MVQFFTSVFLSIIALTLSQTAFSQTSGFPNRPVRVIVGYPAGAGNDLIARAVSQRLTEIWKQPVIVENRAGAGGSIGADYVARSPADGYTLLVTGSSHLIQAAVSKKIPYKAVDDFTPVSTVGSGQLIVEVHPSLPVKNISELIALAKTKRLAYGSAGTGTSPHIAGEMFSRAVGVDMTHVPYKGSAPAQSDLIGGQVNLMFQVTQSALPSVKANQVRAIAVTGKARLLDLPQVPTVAESGLPSYSLEIWWGFLAPNGVNKDILKALNDGVRQAVAHPEVQKQLMAAGLQVGSSSAEDMLKLMRADYEGFVKLVREAGIKEDD